MRSCFLFLVFTVSLFMYSCNGHKSQKSTSVNSELKTELQTYQMVVEGMTCTGCEQTIQANILKLEGINDVTSSHEAKSTVVVFDPLKTDTVAIKAAISSSGYKVLSGAVVIH